MSDMDYSKEVWRSVVGYEGLYSVSDMGRVRRDDRGNFLTPYPNWAGYMLVKLHKDGVKKGFAVHRIVTRAFLGVCPEGKEVNHINAIRHDNRLVNLEYLTRSQNAKHRFDVMGQTGARGEDSNFAKLTWEKVREIRQLGEEGVDRLELASQFGVTAPTISDILKCRTWKE